MISETDTDKRAPISSGSCHDSLKELSQEQYISPFPTSSETVFQQYSADVGGCKQLNAAPTKIRLIKQDFENLTKTELYEKWSRQNEYINFIENQTNASIHENFISLKESEKKLKRQQLEATRRENILVMRLTTKEQEMQDLVAQVQELKQSRVPNTAQLENTLLDPAVNLVFEKTKSEVDIAKAKVEDMQNELSAWKFTPDSNTGKRLMAKCRLLYQENEELGKIISSGRVAKLEADLALQRTFTEDMKQSQSELDEFLVELDEEVEGMQNTIVYLQQQLKDAKEQISSLQHDAKPIVNSEINRATSSNFENNVSRTNLLSRDFSAFRSQENPDCCSIKKNRNGIDAPPASEILFLNQLNSAVFRTSMKNTPNPFHVKLGCVDTEQPSGILNCKNDTSVIRHNTASNSQNESVSVPSKRIQSHFDSESATANNEIVKRLKISRPEDCSVKDLSVSESRTVNESLQITHTSGNGTLKSPLIDQM